MKSVALAILIGLAFSDIIHGNEPKLIQQYHRKLLELEYCPQSFNECQWVFDDSLPEGFAVAFCKKGKHLIIDIYDSETCDSNFIDRVVVRGSVCCQECPAEEAKLVGQCVSRGIEEPTNPEYPNSPLLPTWSMRFCEKENGANTGYGGSAIYVSETGCDDPNDIVRSFIEGGDRCCRK
eukprot:UN00729